MKDLLFKIIITCIAFVAVIFIAAYFFLMFQGRLVISQQLEGLLKKKVTVASFSITPLFRLGVTNLQIEGMGQIGQVYISPSILGSLAGNLAFSDITIINPDLTFEKTAPAVSFAPVDNVAEAAKPPVIPEKVSVKIPRSKINRMNFIFKRVTVKNGKVTFFDKTVGTEGIKIIFKDLNIKLSNLFVMPRSTMTNLEVSALIPWSEGQEEGKLHIDGWVNFYKKDMKATIKIEDIDGIYLYPYYAPWVDLDKAKIEKAKLDFQSNLTALDNNLTAECHLELTDIVRKQRPPEESAEKEERIATAVLDIFKALDQGKIVLDFTIKTKMDRLEFGFKDVRMAFEDKIAHRKQLKPEVVDIVMLPAKIVEGTIRGATDITKAMIDGTFAIGREFKNAMQGSFKKEPKEEKE